jgi:hypothetical protein
MARGWRSLAEPTSPGARGMAEGELAAGPQLAWDLRAEV